MLFTWVTFTNNNYIKILAWKSNYIHDKVWDEIIYPFPNFYGASG